MDATAIAIVVLSFFLVGVGLGVFATGVVVGIILGDAHPELKERLLKK